MSGFFGNDDSGGVGSVFGSPRNAFSDVTGQMSGAVVAVVVIVLAAVVVLGYVVYRFLLSSLKSTKLTSGIVHCKGGAKTVSASKLPALTNGREWSVSFWVYVENAAHTTSDKNILTFGSDVDSAAFMVLMDRNVNRMYLVFKTTQSGGGSAMTALTQFKQGSRPETHIIVPVEYVPMSRWLMLTAVVDQDTVTLYVDNNIYSVVSAARFKQGAIISDPDQSDILIGSASNGADAYLSKLTFYNYGISVFQTRSQYRGGPGSSGVLGWLGVSKYKLQWPVTSATSS